MDAQQIVTLMTAGGGGAALLALITGLTKWLSGASARELEKNTNLVAQRRAAIKERDEADAERDEADRKRRISNEYASKLRRIMIENGLEVPEWPIDSQKEKPDV